LLPKELGTQLMIAVNLGYVERNKRREY